MPSEQQMWTTLRPHMEKRSMDPVRVENPALPGTPDVNYIEGWLELKHADRWPPRGGPLRLKHPPTPEQKTWLYRRWYFGGAAFLLLRVGQEWFLIGGPQVREVWKDHPTEELIRRKSIAFKGPAAVAEWLVTYKREQ